MQIFGFPLREIFIDRSFEIKQILCAKLKRELWYDDVPFSTMIKEDSRCPLQPIFSK